MIISKKDVLSLINEDMEFQGPDRPHPDYERKLAGQDTPFKKVPFPSTGKEGMNFQELLGSESFQEVLDKYKRYNNDGQVINQSKLMKVYQELYGVLNTISQIEYPHRDSLETLAVELVMQEFALPLGVLNFDAKIVSGPEEIDQNQFKHDEGDEEQETPDLEFGNMFDVNPDDEAEELKLEKAKRRLVNATMQGASRIGQYMFHLVEPDLADILGRDDISELYGKMMSSNDLNYWLFPDEMVQQSSKQGGKAGSENIDRNTEPPTIYARGINFPTLVHELIKGLIEFFALKHEDEGYYEKVASEDTITKEDWDLRLGPAIWKRLRASIPPQIFLEEKLELQNYILNHIFNLPAKEYLKLMREVMGGTPNGKKLVEKIARDMESLYNDIHNKKYVENNYADETDDETDDEEPVGPTDDDSGDWWSGMLGRK